MGNKGTINIIGISDVKIKTNLGYKMMLRDMRQVVDLNESF